MPRLDGVLETALYVDDPERSRDFYHRVFGFEAIVSIDRLIGLSVVDRQVLLLFKKGASAHLPQSAHDGDGHLHLAFAIPVEEWEPWLARLDELGVSIEGTRTWPRGGRSVYFRDPDGHLVELATPGTWSIY